MDHTLNEIKRKMWKDGRLLRLVLILLVIESTECQPWLRPRHPLCVSQFALANRACAHLPIYTVPPPAPPGPPPTPSSPPFAPQPPGVPLPPDPLPLGPPLERHRHHHHQNDNDDDQDGDHHKGGHHHHHHRLPYIHGHHHNHTHHHHNHENENDHNHHYGHHHDHEQRIVQEDQSAEGTPVEQECCHWLEQVDSDCVCDILVSLPLFLSKPLHEYTVIVSQVCNVTYACPSRIRL